jgi:hypothetical protein
MTWPEFAYRMNRLTPEQIAQAMESLPTDVLKWAVKFEALSHNNAARQRFTWRAEWGGPGPAQPDEGTK